ncbi:hypothetical protein BD769DRAFT_1776269 [Suillus cothurnatus]|nr:hypothetical protein BD769DRAFT_1776269 [Suillus cothurnatus]
MTDTEEIRWPQHIDFRYDTVGLMRCAFADARSVHVPAVSILRVHDNVALPLSESPNEFSKQWSIFKLNHFSYLAQTTLLHAFHKGSQACLLLLVHAVVTVAAANFTQCLNNTKNNAIATNNFNGLLNGDGGTPANASDSRFAVSILSSLQQVPLRFYPNPSRLYSFIALPETTPGGNVLPNLLTIPIRGPLPNLSSDVYANVQSNGEASGSMWLWLVPIVAGWLQLSPKCDFNRLHAAYDRADRHSLRAGAADVRTGMLPASSRRALAITAKEEDVMSPDEFLNPPVFNYSRSLRWAYTAETICLVFKVASEKAHVSVAESDTTTDDYSALMHNPQPGEAQSSHWAPGVFTRMAIASCASLALQWGTVGATLLVSWFTPTTGIGCRTMDYFLYGVMSTLIWMMLLMSSILAHYSAAYSHRPPPSARVALALSHCLRWTGKLCAVINFFLVVLACVFQYSNFYDRCFCNSSVFSRRGGAYAVIIETAAEAERAKAAWIGALALACTSASVFLGVVIFYWTLFRRRSHFC